MKINPVSPQSAAHRPAAQPAASGESGDAGATVSPAFTLSLTDHADKVLKGGSEASANSTAHRAAQMIHDDSGAYADYKNFGQVVASLVRQDAVEAEAATATGEGDGIGIATDGTADETVAEPTGDETVVVEDPIPEDPPVSETDTSEAAPVTDEPPVEEPAVEGDSTDIVPEITVDTTTDMLDELIEATDPGAEPV